MSQRPIIIAVVYDKHGNVLSIGHNSYVKTHPTQARYAYKAGQPYRVYLHAEIAALVKCERLDKARTLIITRNDAYGRPRLAKPCPICSLAIRESNIRKVIYSTNDGSATYYLNKQEE